jgi:hypothetical protein
MAIPRNVLAVAFALGLLGSTDASALTITLSDMSSDATPASSLDATLEITVIGGDTLQLIATNNTTAPNDFNISEVFWNGGVDVTSLALSTATHSVNGDVFAAWNPVEVGTMVDGFGIFDFGFTDGVGEGNPNVIKPGTSITFVLAITGACATALDCEASDFLFGTSQGKSAAMKFVNGPDDPESPGDEDSAWGAASLPEPGTGLLVGLGAADRCTRASGPAPDLS